MVGTSSAAIDPLLGVTLGKDYLVVERIGVGGMAVVYLVEHQTLLKRFAAKVLSSEHATSVEARARFTQEAHAASQLDHENIVTISDFGITPDHRPYFVMELLRGKTLADRLDDGPMTLEEVVAVSVPVARALAHAHAEGIIHRDVKPENIFLVQRSQGRWGVKVLDFGIAKLPINDRMTKTGQALGSPMFMAPEACRGDEVDQRADIYSFGIVLYLMLAGRVPFSDENLLKVLQMQVVAPLPLPSSFNPNLPAALELVLIRALAKDPDDRYETMQEFLFAFEAALPDHSDALLIQAQFGAGVTPFPGTLARVRSSGRISQHPYNITGEHDVARSSTTPQMQAAQIQPAQIQAVMPPAPKRSRRVALVVSVLALAAVGAGGYVWMQQSNSKARAATVSEPAASPVQKAPVASTRVAVAAPSAPTEVPTEVPTDAPSAPTQAVASHVAVVETPATRPKRAPIRTLTKVAATTRVLPTKNGSAATPPPIPSTTQAVVSTPPTPIQTSEPIAAPTTTLPTPQPVQKPPTPLPTAPVVVGSMDATPIVASLDVNGPLPASVVRRGIERVLPSLRACYRTAAASQKKTPAVTISLRFDIDESSVATNVSGGATSFGSMASCARSAIGQIQTQQAPDVGIAQVAVTIRFTPL